MYTSTTYGFGMRVADIKASGGDVKTAMKVNSPRVHQPSPLKWVRRTLLRLYTDLVF
jgi:hypothetical protein